MAVKENVKQKQGVGVEMALQALEEGKRPMSPDQIKGKYQLEFPFTVRRVVNSPISVWPETDCSCGLKAGTLITFKGVGPDVDGKPSYLFECGHYGLNPITPSSESFVLADNV